SARSALPEGVSNATPYWGQGNWQVSILVYIEQENLRNQYFDYGINNGRNYYHADNLNGATGQVVPSLLCPSDNGTNPSGWPGSATSKNATYHNYVVNFGNTAIDESANWQVATFNGFTFAGAPFTRSRPVRLVSIIDGSSNTLMLSEL